MKTTTLEWVKKAEGNFGAVLSLRRSRRRDRYDVICNLCHQCMEKYLKARLVEAGISFQRTHNLASLVELAKQVEPLWIGMNPQLKTMDEYAVEVRYPGKNAINREAVAAYQTCKHLRSLARASLGLKP